MYVRHFPRARTSSGVPGFRAYALPMGLGEYRSLVTTAGIAFFVAGMASEAPFGRRWTQCSAYVRSVSPTSECWSGLRMFPSPCHDIPVSSNRCHDIPVSAFSLGSMSRKSNRKASGFS